ncbi:MAG: NUDIX hydrolase [Acidimicrobiales bacterium]
MTPDATTVVPPRDAATLMLVRDGGLGLEVFMVRRALSATFVGGAFVFPGGTLDPADRHAEVEAMCNGLTDAEASTRLGIGAGGLAFWVAAVRECFEEAGLLLARAADGRPVGFDDPVVAARFAGHREALTSNRGSMSELCRQENLRLSVGDIHYFAHWITPTAAPRRFDTRFFVAAAPLDQDPLHNPGELIGQAWIRPADAIEGHRQGTFDLILPTIRNLEAIARFERAEDLLNAAAAVPSVPTVVPRLVQDDEGLRILLPGDPGYTNDLVEERA